MITVMRNKFKANGMTYIIWISLASMLLGSIVPSLFKKDYNEPWAVKVNGEEISYRSFMQEHAKNREYIMRLRSQYGQFADYFLQSMGVKDASSLTFKQLVTHQLMAQAMKKAHINVDTKFIAYKLHDVNFVTRYCSDIFPAHFINSSGILDSKALRGYLQQRGITVEQFQQQVQEKVNGWLFNHLVQTCVYTPDYISEYGYMQKNGQKSYSFVNFDHTHFLKIARKNAISSEELAQFFEQENKQNHRYFVPEKRTGAFWEFSPKSYGLAIDSEVVEQYYEKNKTQKYVAAPIQLHAREITIAFNDETKQAALQKISGIHRELMEDASRFAELARKHSTDDYASRGGEMPPFVRGKQEHAFDRAAFILKNDGDISPVVVLDDRYVIIQRIKKEQQSYKPLKEVYASIEQELIEKEFARTFGKEAKEMLATQDGELIARFVKNHNGTPSSLTSLARHEGGSSSNALFEIKKEQTYSFYVEGSKGFIVRLDTIEKGYTPSLEAIQQTVIDDFYSKQASKLIEQAVATVRAQAQQASFQQVAQENKLAFDQIKDLSSTNTALFKELRDKGFDPVALLNMEKTGAFSVQENGFDRYLVRLDKIIQGENTTNQESQQASDKQLKKQQENAFIGSFIASLYRDATIDTNDTIAMIDEENSI